MPDLKMAAATPDHLDARAVNGRRRTVAHEPLVRRLEIGLVRQPASVGLARQLLDVVLQAMGVDPMCRGQMLLALSEGCTNVVRHAADADGYQVRVAFDDGCCTVDIIDSGRGAVRLPIDRSMPDAIDQGGRGLSIMAMSTDSLQLTPRRPHGLAVRFTKQLY